MLLLKNQQFLPNHYETLSKLGTYEDLILTKFRNDWVKEYLNVSPDSPGHTVRLNV